MQLRKNNIKFISLLYLLACTILFTWTISYRKHVQSERLYTFYVDFGAILEYVIKMAAYS